MQTKTIVILGGGYAGVNTAVNLIGANVNAKIVLVDRQDYHLYYPNIYEIASSEEEFTGLAQLKSSIALSFKDILPKGVEFVKGNIEKISEKDKFVLVDGKKISFDYLVVGLGATVDFFNIPGVAENAMTMKSLTDALKIRNAIEFLVQSHRQDMNKRVLRVVVAGGGFTGVELAGELTNLMDILSWKNNYPLDRLQIEVIEGSNQLLTGMPEIVSSTVLHRLKRFNVNVLLNSLITSVSKTQFTLNNGEVINYDLLIWTGGVRSASVPFEGDLKKDRRGRFMVEPDLTLQGYNNIFMVGDNACIMDGANPMPQTATQAIMHADYLPIALNAKINNKTVPAYRPESSPFIIPVRGKWAVLRLPNGFTMVGLIPWIIKIFAAVRYFNRLMPLGKAIKLAWFETEVFIKND